MICRHPGCGTRLSRFNLDVYCAIHIRLYPVWANSLGRRLLRHLYEHGGGHYRDLAETLGVSPQRLSSAVQPLRRAGWIQTDGQGVWSLDPDVIGVAS